MLRLTFEPDSNGIGQLFAEVKSRGFSGHSSAWFHVDDLVAFARKLATSYPLTPDAPLKLEGGYLKKIDGGIEQIHLGLKFFPSGSVGHVACRVSLTDPFSDHGRPDSESTVVVELGTTYEPLRTFAKSLEALATG